MVAKCFNTFMTLWWAWCNEIENLPMQLMVMKRGALSQGYCFAHLEKSAINLSAHVGHMVFRSSGVSTVFSFH